ncbi:MAG: GNAT family N-acetyltransferase [Candidatus Thorarchaeota archaeon]|jgi:RimJ/RimL family protein N-acetyltransferase
MIVGEKVRLVPLEVEKHLDHIMEHFNDSEMRILLGGYIPVTRNAEIEWIKATEEKMKKRMEFIFAIERISDGEMIGSLGLHDIDWLSQTCVLGIAIYPKKNWEKGYGTEALELLIDFGWTHLNLRRIELGVHDHNPRAKHVYEKLGFKVYGTAHQKYYMDGRYVDTIYMELFRE